MIERRPCINLPRAINARLGLVHDFLEIGDPARHSSNGKDNSEHLSGDADGAHNDAAVEIDVRVKLAFQEIRIMKGGLFQLVGYVQQWVRNVQGTENIVAGLFDNFGPRIIIAVNPVPESHQSLPAMLVFGRLDEPAAVVAGFMNVLQHLDYRLV